MSKDRITNHELVRELEADSRYLAERAKRDAIFDNKRKALIADQHELLLDLKQAGLNVSSIWDLVNGKETYAHCIDIIIKHLHRPYMDRNLEGMARALAIKDAKYAWNELKNLYELSPNPSGQRNGLAVALSHIYENSRFSDLIKLLKDTNNGDSRVLLLAPLKRRKNSNPNVRKIVEELSRDPDLMLEINDW